MDAATSSVFHLLKILQANAEAEAKAKLEDKARDEAKGDAEGSRLKSQGSTMS